MRVTRRMHIRPSFMDFRVNGKSRRIDRLFANHNLAIFIDQNQIADADLREVSRKRVEPCEQPSAP